MPYTHTSHCTPLLCAAGGQVAFPRIRAYHRAAHRLPASGQADHAVLSHLPRHREAFQGAVAQQAVHREPHGRADPQGYHPILRIRGGEAKGPLPQHTVFQGARLLTSMTRRRRITPASVWEGMAVWLVCFSCKRCVQTCHHRLSSLKDTLWLIFFFVFLCPSILMPSEKANGGDACDYTPQCTSCWRLCQLQCYTHVSNVHTNNNCCCVGQRLY